MRKFRAVMLKELFVLLRDLPGLMILFLMPLLLVIVVTLTQEKALNQKDAHLDLVLVDQDTSEMSHIIEQGLEKSHYFNIIRYVTPGKGKIEEIQASVAEGHIQIAIFISQGAGEMAKSKALHLIEKAAQGGDANSTSGVKQSGNQGITLLFDPAIKEAYKSSVLSAVKMLVQGAEIKLMMDKFKSVLSTEINRQFKEKMLSYTKKDIHVNIPDFAFNDEINRQLKSTITSYSKEEVHVQIPEFNWEQEQLIPVSETYAHQELDQIKPSIVQNNVPGFSLFAMFFIVIPLAGSIINERNEGVHHRIKTLPVHYAYFISGKVVVYSLVCMLQFFLLLLTGMFVIPLFDQMPALAIGNNYFSIIATAYIASLSAVGFGLIIGTLAKTHGQAATFGSVMIVVLAILGGIFIPIYLMSPGFKIISEISPLRWGLSAFIDLFVRNATFASVFPDLLKLMLFFIVSIGIASLHYTRRN